MAVRQFYPEKLRTGVLAKSSAKFGASTLNIIFLADCNSSVKFARKKCNVEFGAIPKQSALNTISNSWHTAHPTGIRHVLDVGVWIM